MATITTTNTAQGFVDSIAARTDTTTTIHTTLICTGTPTILIIMVCRFIQLTHGGGDLTIIITTGDGTAHITATTDGVILRTVDTGDIATHTTAATIGDTTMVTTMATGMDITMATGMDTTMVIMETVVTTTIATTTTPTIISTTVHAIT